MEKKPIKSALISVFHKTGLDEIVHLLDKNEVKIYSTGGTQAFIEGLGVSVYPVEELTGYPSILDGRVKTLHPKVFGGILARREAAHLDQLVSFDIPEIDMVMVDLYPFEETVKSGGSAEDIIEKIDIGGISLIRAAAKNHRDVVIVPSQEDYAYVREFLSEGAFSHEAQRAYLATKAFMVSSHYDTAIFDYFNAHQNLSVFKRSEHKSLGLRYGENPHQSASYFGDMDDLFDILGGKALSYNNLIDVDAALHVMKEFEGAGPTFAVLKHNNTCGLATRTDISDAWDAALAGDPISAFGGILIANTVIGLDCAVKIDQLFYEVLIAPGFEADALELLSKKKNRILLKLKKYPPARPHFRSLLNGIIQQDPDLSTESADQMKAVTREKATEAQIEDLIFANKCTKHLKSNAIALVKNKQLLGMGCGQTSRVDALQQAIHKARSFGFDLKGSVMSSEAFFPFPDCVQIAHEAGIVAVVQPGGSVKDSDSIAYCDQVGMAMMLTGVRHFKH